MVITYVSGTNDVIQSSRGGRSREDREFNFVCRNSWKVLIFRSKNWAGVWQRSYGCCQSKVCACCVCNLRLKIDFMGLIYRGGSWFEVKIRRGRSSICCAAFGGISEVFIVGCALGGID